MRSPDAFRHAPPRADAPPPRAIFTSNPLRGLDWLLDLWARRIHPALPQAELHLYCGPSVYGAVGEAKAAPMRGGAGARRRARGQRRAAVRAAAARRAHRGAAPEPRDALSRRRGRDLLPRRRRGAGARRAGGGAAAWARCPSACIDGVTGSVASDDESFARRAIALLADDALWRRQHAAALRLQKGLGVDDVARRFEALGAEEATTA